jgi:hypothetical protein
MAIAPLTSVVRLDFGDGKQRKLKCRHKFLREAVRVSGKSVTELINDPFGGYPYLLQALLQPGSTEGITLDKASDLIDSYLDAHNNIKGLTTALVQVISGYLQIEMTPTEDEESEDGTVPNADSPVAPGLSGD